MSEPGLNWAWSGSESVPGTFSWFSKSFFLSFQALLLFSLSLSLLYQYQYSTYQYRVFLFLKPKVRFLLEPTHLTVVACYQAVPNPPRDPNKLLSPKAQLLLLSNWPPPRVLVPVRYLVVRFWVASRQQVC